MTLTLDPGQAKLAERSSVMAVPLVVLETFSDRDAQTVSKTYYWSSGIPLWYAWDDVTPVAFQPRIQSLDPIENGFDHLPNAGSFDTRQEVRFTIDTSPRAGAYLWEELRQENLIGARVTVGTILVERTDDPRFWDLSSLGRVHVVRFRGELTAMPTLAGEEQLVELVAETFEPPVRFRRMTKPGTAVAEDLGKAYPVPIGKGDGIQPLRIDPGARTQLAQSLTASQLGLVELVDAGDFFVSAQAQRAYIGDENVQYDAVDIPGNRINITQRGVDGTTAVAHEEGATIYDGEPYPRWCISAEPILGLRNVYVEAENGDLVTLAADKQWNLENTQNTDPGEFVGALQMSADTLAAAFSGLGAGPFSFVNAILPRVFVDVDGIYSLSGSPTTLFDLDGDIGNWTTFIGGAGIANIVAITDGLQLQGVSTAFYAGFRRSLTGSSVPGEIRFKLEVPTVADVANLAHIFIVLADASDPIPATTPYDVVSTRASLTLHSQNLNPGEVLDLRFALHNTFARNTAPANPELRIFITPKTFSPNINVNITGLVEFDSAAAVLDHPMDVVTQYVEENAGFPAGTVDAASFAAAKANLPGVFWAGDLTTLGESFGEVMARFAYESRTNWVWSSQADGSPLLKASNARTSFDFPVPTRELETWTDLEVSTRELPEIANGFELLYKPRAGARLADPESYQATLVADDSRNDLDPKVSDADIADSQTRFGKRPASTSTLTLVTEMSVAQEVFGYYCQEALEGQRLRLSLVAPFWEAYDLEPGDTLTVQPAWAPAPIAVRVTRVVFSVGVNGIGLNLEEIPTS